MAYGQLAKRLGEPDAARAVGAANAANPIVIIVPCHRVIGANGRLVGFGGGLNRKRILLDLESGRAAFEFAPCERWVSEHGHRRQAKEITFCVQSLIFKSINHAAAANW
jgi:O-6-methylguanine DNA methyltransferase